MIKQHISIDVTNYNKGTFQYNFYPYFRIGVCKILDVSGVGGGF